MFDWLMLTFAIMIFNISNPVKLEYNALDIGANNYLSWILNGEIHLDVKFLLALIAAFFSGSCFALCVNNNNNHKIVTPPLKITKPITMVHDESKSCCGRCKAVVRKIVEEVRAEAEQWSQMQEMLAQVRGEMEELRASRDFWENRAYNADHEIQCLGHAVDVWKVKALEYKNKANELQLELSVLKEETQKSKPASSLPPFPPVIQLKKEKLLSNFRLKKTRTHVNEEGRNKFENAVEELNAEVIRAPKEELTPLSLGKQLAKEKRILLRRLKEKNRHHHGNEEELSGSADGRRKKTSYSINDWNSDPKHSSLTDIESLSPFARQRSRSAFGFCSPESSRMRNSFKINK
ncbi:hypothetical protein OROHE_005158 [Orobanche hederae]